uniref:putative Ig domain-containing protein n=1 Tax=Parapedobacter soli TaxID=416955 RepID=UPI0021CAAF4D
MKNFSFSALIGFLLLFTFHGVRGQTTIQFNDVDGGGYGLSYSEGGFSFSINDPGNGRVISSQLSGGFGNSKCLWDNNDGTSGFITRWTIKKTDNSSFQFRGIYLRDPGLGGSPSGTITAYKSGDKIGNSVPTDFNGNYNESFATNDDFFDVDEIRIEAADINFFLDHFTYGPPFSVTDEDPAEVLGISLVGDPASTATTVSYTVTFSKAATNVDITDFELTKEGSATGTIASLTGSGTTYTVVINGISGEGNIRLDLKSGTDIENEDGTTGTAAFTGGQSHYVTSCFMETFDQGETDDATTFSGNGKTFTLTGNWTVNTETPVNGIGGSAYNLERTSGTGPFTIAVDDGAISVQGLYLFLSSDSDGVDEEPTGSGSVTIRGLLAGSQVYTFTKTSGFATDFNANSGYTYINFSAESGDHTAKLIDQLEISIGGAFAYLSLDNFSWCVDEFPPAGYTVSIDQNPVTADNQTVVSFTFADAEVGATYNYTFTGTGGTPVTGTGTVTTATQQITGINLTGLDEGTVTLSVTLTDASGNIGTAATSTTTKIINNDPTDIVLSNASVNQSGDVDAEIGTLTTTDADAGDTHTYALVSGTGGDDNDAFDIFDDSGDWKLRAKDASSLAAGTYSILIRTTDNKGSTYEKPFTIIVVDDVAPTISSVSVPTDATYVAGQNLDFTVNVSENVTVTGTPQLALTIGSTSVNAAYIAGGSTTTALLFRYTIQVGEADTDGIAVGSLTLNGGTINDGASHPLTLTLNGVGTTTGVLVDGIAPSINSVNVPADATYGIGQTLSFTVNFDEAVTVYTAGGTPRIPLIIGSDTRYASYASGTETSALVFTYTVAGGDQDLDGVSVGTGGIDLNGGALQDAAGNNAALALNSIGSTTGVLVDGVAPTVSSFSPVNGATDMEPDDNLVVTFSENIALGTGNIVIYDDADAPVATIDVESHGGQLSITDDILTINPTADLLELNDYYVHIGSDAIHDLAGNAYAGINNNTTWAFTVADVTAPSGYSVSIDQTTITLANHTAMSFTFSGAEVGATFDYVVTSSGGGAPVTGTGTITAAGQQVTGIDVSGLANGTLALSVTLTDASDNEGAPVTDNVTKAVNYPPDITTSVETTPFTESVTGAPVPVSIDDALTIGDPDNTTLASATVAITGNFQSGQDVLVFVNDGSIMDNIDGSYDGGILTLTSAGASATLAEWQAALRSVTYSNTSQNPNTGDRTISFVVNDGLDNSAPATKTVTVAAVNTAPVITVPTSIPVVEDVASALIGISFADGDAGTGSVTTTFTVLDGALAATARPGVTVGGSPDALTLSGSISDINAFLADSSLTYTPVANSTTSVTLTVDINDNGNSGPGGSQSDTETMILEMATVNDAPTVTAPINIAVTEDVASPLTGISFADLDAGSGEVFVTLSVPIGTLNASSGAGVTVGGTSNALTLTGNIANINAFIAASNVTYTTALNATVNVMLTVTIDDNGHSGSGGSKTDSAPIILLVTAVNDAPVITNVDGDVVTYTEDGPAILLDAGSDATVTDPDSPDLNGSSLTVAIIANGATGEDQLAIRNEGPGMVQINVSENNVFYGITHLGIKAGGTGGADLVVTFAPTATLAAVQALIRNLTYSNSNTTNPSVNPRTIRITMNDSDGGTSLPSDLTVNVTAVNDAPVVTTSGGTTTFTEPDGDNPEPVPVDPGLTVADPDNITLASATVSITGGSFQTGEDILAFTNDGSTMGNIEGNYDDATGILTLTVLGGGTAPLDEWESALRAVMYSNSSQNPNTTTRTITFVINDGTADSSPATKDVDVVAVNTAPVAVDDPVTVIENTPATGNVLTNDSDVEGNALAASLMTAPANGMIVLNTDGSFTYTPNSNYNGLDSLQYEVCDNGTPSRCHAAWVHFTVSAVNDAPTITGTPATTVNQDAAYSFIPDADDIEDDDLTFSIANKPDWATFDPATGELSGTPGNDDVGITTGIVITVSDGELDASLAAFDLEVVNVNDAPTIGGTPATSINQDAAYSFTPTAADIDAGDVLTFSIFNKPDWATFNATTGELSGTPGNDDVGVITGIIISVSDGAASASLPAFDLEVVNVNDAPTISGIPATTVNQDAAYSFTPTAADIDADNVLTFSIANKPDWAAFNTTTGELSGTPGNGDVGVTAGIVITVSDGALDASLAAFDLEVVNVNDAPTISGTPVTTVNQDVAYSFTPTAYDIDAVYVLTFSITNNPDWASFNTTTGELSGTPRNGDVGVTAGIVITVSDGALDASLAAFDLEVVNVNDAPTISGTPVTTVNQDVAYSFIPTANDIDAGDVLTFSITNKPDWATFKATTGELSGTPRKGDVGVTAGIVLTVSDGALDASLAAFDLEVVNVNDAPTISCTPVTTVNQDVAYSFSPTATDIDAGDVLTFSITNKPDWATFNANTGELSGTPHNEDVGVTTGIIITVSDGSLDASLPAFDLEVVNVNDAPTISGTPATTVNQDAAYSFTPTAADIDAGDVLTFSITNKPDWATFNANTGELSGTPHNEDVGVTTGIIITVSDGSLDASLPAFDLEVVNVNDAPTISGTPATTVNQDAAYSFTPTAADIDAGDVLTFSITNKPDWATFNATTGELSGTPGNGDVGVTTGIIFTVSDGSLDASLPAFDLEVVNVNDAPTISGTPATTVNQDAAYRNTPTAADIDAGDVLTFSITNKPDWATFNATTGELSGTPGNGDVGVTTGIIFTVSDGSLDASLPAFDLEVVNVNDAPTISGTPATTMNQDAVYSFSPSAADIDAGDVLTFSITNKPDWATFNATTGELSGTPGNGDVCVTAGRVISVSDGTMSASLPAFDLEVVNVNDAPTIGGTSETSINQDAAYSFIPTANDIDAGDVLTFSITNKPDWATFNTTTGELSGTPGNGDVGVTAGIVITVSDGTMSASLPAFDLEVVNVNDAPTLGGTSETSINQDAAYSFIPTANDIDAGDVLTFSITNKPDWATFNTTTGELSG